MKSTYVVRINTTEHYGPFESIEEALGWWQRVIGNDKIWINPDGYLKHPMSPKETRITDDRIIEVRKGF